MKSKTHRMMRPRAVPGWRSLVLSLTLLCLFALATVLVVRKTQAAGQLPLPVTILQFGAFPGDGRDDTDAMQASADYLSAHPGTTLIYPPGVYNITRIVDYAHEHANFGADESLFRGIAVVYSRCTNVKILGVGAIIDVKGDFEKGIDHVNDADPRFGEATTYAFNPFMFIESSGFTLSGFEIRGNVDRTTQSDKSIILVPRFESGIFSTRSHDYVLENLYVHHMLTDGILLVSDHHFKMRHVTVANNERNAMSLTGQVKDIEVTDSVFRDSAVVGTAPNSYPGSSPAAGVDIEPEAFPEGADWGVPGTPGFHLAGNMLFNRVRVTGNLGTQIGMAHGQASANVTVRNSFIQNPTTEHAFLLSIGIAGGVVEDSVLDAQKGYLWVTTEDASVPQHDSLIYKQYLVELAADPFAATHGIYTETRSISTILRRNTIRGRETLLYDPVGLPFLEITDNEFQGEQPATIPAAPGSIYNAAGYMFVAFGRPVAGRTWTPEARIERNRFFIPQTAPRRADPAHGFGDIIYQGVTHLAGNQYTTNGSSGLPFHVAYDRVGTVVNDRFPTNGLIIPIHGPIESSEGNSGPYMLRPGGTLNIPQ